MDDRVPDDKIRTIFETVFDRRRHAGPARNFGGVAADTLNREGSSGFHISGGALRPAAEMTALSIKSAGSSQEWKGRPHSGSQLIIRRDTWPAVGGSKFVRTITT